MHTVEMKRWTTPSHSFPCTNTFRCWYQTNERAKQTNCGKSFRPTGSKVTYNYIVHHTRQSNVYTNREHVSRYTLHSIRCLLTNDSRCTLCCILWFPVRYPSEARNDEHHFSNHTDVLLIIYHTLKFSKIAFFYRQFLLLALPIYWLKIAEIEKWKFSRFEKMRFSIDLH